MDLCATNPQDSYYSYYGSDMACSPGFANCPFATRANHNCRFRPMDQN